MSFEDHFSVIEKAMESLGYHLLSTVSVEKMFGNGSAEFEKEKCLSLQVTVDRSDLLLAIKPAKGFASWRWYDALDLLKKLEYLGYPVQWAKDTTPSSNATFLVENIPLLLELQGQLQFSYFNGVSLEKLKHRAKDTPS
jgi:hypothetical protein